MVECEAWYVKICRLQPRNSILIENDLSIDDFPFDF